VHDRGERDGDDVGRDHVARAEALLTSMDEILDAMSEILRRTGRRRTQAPTQAEMTARAAGGG
jgi:hypothetical protein